MSEQEKDAVSGVETTGHSWDGIKELNTPLPRWWLWTFYATIVWSLGYVMAYPALPLISGAPKGVTGYSSRADVHEAMAEARADQAGMLRKIEALPLAEVRDDPSLFQFAVAGGRAAFAVNCSQCHGSGAEGSPGYPNLNDDVWLWGGSLEAIHTTLLHGVRFAGDENTRFAAMPAFGRDGVLEWPAILATAHHVRRLAGLEHDPTQANAGLPIYEDNCAACHKSDGAGDREQGAPDLKDAIWHYGSGLDDIARQISNPRHGVMPGWKDRLDAATLKQLAIYVHALGGGE